MQGRAQLVSGPPRPDPFPRGNPRDVGGGRGARAPDTLTQAHTHTCNVHTPGCRLHGTAGAVGHPHAAVRPHAPSLRCTRGTPPAPQAGRSQPALANRYRAPSHAGGAGLGLSLLSAAAPLSRRRRAGPREGGASRAPLRTHHRGIAVRHRSRHLLARRAGVHGWRPGGGGGRGTRRAGGDPGAVLRRAGARVRGWSGARTHTPARGRARLGPGADRAGWAGAEGEGSGRRRGPGGRRWPQLPGWGLPSRGCFLPRGAAVASRGRKVTRAASRWPWEAFKGRRGPARELGTGRGPGWAAAACSACPAPRPLEGGGRLRGGGTGQSPSGRAGGRGSWGLG